MTISAKLAPYTDRGPVERLRVQRAAFRVHMPIHLQRRADLIVEGCASGGADVANTLSQGRLAPLVHQVVVSRLHVHEALVVDDAADLPTDDDSGVDGASEGAPQTVGDAQLAFIPLVAEPGERRSSGEDPVELVGVAHADILAVLEVEVLQATWRDIIEATEEARADVRRWPHQRLLKPHLLEGFVVAVGDVALVLRTQVEVEVGLDEARCGVAVQGPHACLQFAQEGGRQVPRRLGFGILAQQGPRCRSWRAGGRRRSCGRRSCGRRSCDPFVERLPRLPILPCLLLEVVHALLPIILHLVLP